MSASRPVNDCGRLQLSSAPLGLDPTVILLANSAFAQCSHQIRPEFGWIGGFRGRIAHFCLPWSAQRRIRQQYQQSCHQPPNWNVLEMAAFVAERWAIM